MTHAPDIDTSHDVAIVGRACRLPGAKSVVDLWSLLHEGRCSVTSIPADRWGLQRNFHPRLAERGKTYTWAAGVLDDVWGFDPSVFGISPREAEQMDPQQRLLLELAWEAFEDAGMPPSKIAGSDIGVFIGASAVDTANLRMADMASADAYMMTGNTLSIISNRLSYIFDLHGPSFTVDTACSSALVATQAALANLQSGRVDTALVGGVSILASHHSFVGFSQAVMLSRRGLCQAFSADADGYVRAEGGVVLVLKTRAAAERDGDRIFGFIVAAEVNSDGRTNGISLPSKTSQAKLLEKLYLTRNVDLDSIAFVEAHGTGTPVGDPIEAAAIGETIGRGRSTPLLIGSIKTNIGHMEAAAGLGGLLKATLALEHDTLPPSLHSATLNAHIDFDALNLRVARELTPLARPPAGRRRLAGVNSFGFGGTNAHVIIADAPRRTAPPVTTPAASFLVLSAHSRGALAALASDYAARLDAASDDEATALIAATAHRRDRLPQRIVVPVGERTEMVAALDGLGDEEQETPGAVRGTAIERAAPVAFVFSGNGSQFAGMGLAAYAHSRAFRARFDAISAGFEALAGWSLVGALHDEDLGARLRLTQVSQPLLFAIQSATCHTLRQHGLEPACVLGHSVGEVAAAEAAGILDPADALATIFARSLHQELAFGQGAMAVIVGSREAAEAIVADLPGLEIAAYNSPRAFTVSGPKATLERLSDVAREHKARVRKLDLAYPFHSAAMAPVEAPLRHDLADLRHAPSRIPFVSTVTGAILDGADVDPAYWWRNVREPVRFSDAVAAAVDHGARVFVEIGPMATLLSHVVDVVDEHKATIATMAALDKRDKGVDPLRLTIAQVIARGGAIVEATAYGARPAAGIGEVSLPHYPWQRKTYRLAETSEIIATLHTGSWHPLIGARTAADQLEWRLSLDTTLYPSLADHCVDGRAILPGAAFAEMVLAVARDWLGVNEVTVSDIEITSPMQLTADASREVMCRVSPVANHVEILSRPRMSASPWQLHVTAKIVRDAKVGTLPPFDDHASLAPSHSVTGAEIYRMAARAGLQYGPTFRKLATAAAVRADRIVLDLTKDAADPAFGIDPARLDSCFHALVLVFSSLRDAVHGTAYIPVRFGEIMLRRPGATFVRARIDVLRRDERIIVANFLLVDAADETIAYMREARFQAIRTNRVSAAVSEMIYQTAVLASEPTAARNDHALSLSAFRDGIVGASASQPMRDDYVLLEGWATALGLRTARALATANFIDVETLVATGRLPKRVRPWLEDMLGALERSGLCHEDRLGRHIDPMVALPEPEEILRTIAHEHQARAGELLVAASTLIAVDAIAAGEGAQPIRPLTSKVIDGYEIGSVQAQAAAAYLNDLVVASMRSWPADRATRILQVGSGPLTSFSVSISDRVQARLTVFDPDRRRLERARMSFADRGNIGFVEKIDDLPASGFDLVIAASTLHRYVRTPGFWAGLRRALAPGAVLAAVEPLPSFFRDLVFGLDACLDTDDKSGFRTYSVGEADWLETMQAIDLDEAQVVHIETSAEAALLLTGKVAAERRRRDVSGAAVILGGDDANSAQTTSALGTLLASSGVHVSLVLDDNLSPENLADSPPIIVILGHTAGARVSPTKALLDQCMRFKRLVDCLGSSPTRLWLVASGAVVPSDERETDVAAGFWAFSRTIANEVPSLDIRRVDVAPDVKPEILAERLHDLVLSDTPETEILLGATTTRVVRFETAPVHERYCAGRAEAARLRRGEGSGIDRIHWETAERQAPGPMEVEISVQAIGLNFRDVMFGLGLLPEDILEHGFAGPTLGLECAGRVERVGAAVKGIKRGDRVMAFARNAFATHVTTPAAVVAPIGSDMPFEAAATIPVAFLTAYYALMICARLKAGEWVLVHGGAGGVGLAAIQIAHWRGAKIIATAGSPERRALLRSLGADHVFDSRSGAFVEDVRQATGEGVAVVLNSLSGEAMERSIAILRPFGRFVELGKRDYVANTHIGLRPFRRNLSYFGVDLDQLLIDEPATSRLLMRSVMRLFASRDLAALPYRVFEAGETIEAFRLMQQSGHVGKLVVRPPDPAVIRARRRPALQIAVDKTHLVTGGLGGFGLATAQWLASRGARHIMLVGRSAPSETAAEAIAALSAQGVRVRVESIDVADKAALQGLFARFGRDLPPLGGVTHAAMVLDDALFVNLTPEKVERVLRPKVAGADNLDRLTRDMKLDYFVLYSSATTLLGNPGQAAYVAANGYLEGLARRRRHSGLPALAVAWGAIEDVGVLARSQATRDMLAKRAGVKGMPAQDALRLLGDLLAAPASEPEDAVVTIAPINWAAARKHLAILDAPAYDKLASHDEAIAPATEKMDIGAIVASCTSEEARKRIGGLIVDEIARVLRLPREDVARTSPLSEIGLDSLMAVELALGLEDRFTLHAPLSTTASGFTVNELADHIIGLATGASTSEDALARTMIERHLGQVAVPADTGDIIRANSEKVKNLLDP